MPRGRPAKYNCPCKVSANAEAWKVKMVRKLGRSVGDLLNMAMDMVIMDAIQTNNPAITPEDVRTFKNLVAFGIDDSLARMVEQRRGDTPPQQFTEEDAPDCKDESGTTQEAPETPDEPGGDPDNEPQGIDPSKALDILEEVLMDVPDMDLIDNFLDELNRSYNGSEHDTFKVLESLEIYLTHCLERLGLSEELEKFRACTADSLKPLEWWLKLQRKANRYGNDS